MDAMGKTFKDLLGAEESLFTRREAFDPEYLPDNYIHRGSQIQAIATCIKPALGGTRPINAQVYGPPATGKTTAMRKLMEDLGDTERGERVAVVHINCQIHTSKFSIFSQIHKAIIGHLPPETGVPFKRVYDAIFKKLIEEKKVLLVVLDDMNHLFYDRHANEVMYDILRAHEVYPGAKTGLFSIVSDTDFNYKIEDKVRSMFQPHEIFFPPYTAGEILDILSDRVKVGFVPGVISNEAIDEIATRAHKHGDLRMGIELLRRSAEMAEMAAARRIEEEHIQKAIGDSSKMNLKKILDSLSKEEGQVLKVLAGAGGESQSGNLYEAGLADAMSYTTFFRVLEKLEGLRIVDLKFTGKGKKGRSRTIYMRHDKEEILSLL